MNKFLKEFKDRGFYYQCTNDAELSSLMDNSKIKAYIGFDCTAESLHVGSLLQIMCLRLLQKHGHQPIVLIGGGTTRIGDPSGKDKTRKILDENEINKNINNIEKILRTFLNTEDEKTKPIFVNNYDWLKNLNYISFLREIGKHFTINKMLTFDSVKLRLDREQSLSYMEFNYMILQAYDFLELNKKNNCVLQIGGSDQWGNIVNGVDLIKRYSGNQAYGLTTPLITTASGAKMGKTESGAIWLDKNFLSAYDYWQFWRNTDDRDVIKFLNIFTDLETDKINDIKDQNINDLKIILANEVTAMLHGIENSKKAEQAAKQIFENKSLSEDMPTLNLDNKDAQNGVLLSDLIVQMKYANSKSESRKLIRGKGVKLNGKIVENELQLLDYDQITQFENVISVGKKKHFKVIIG